MTEEWKTGRAANKDRKVTLMRAAKTKTTHRYGMGGLLKNKWEQPRPVTLPKLKTLESRDD